MPSFGEKYLLLTFLRLWPSFSLELTLQIDTTHTIYYRGHWLRVRWQLLYIFAKV